MEIATYKLELINQIIKLDDISVFSKIKNILKNYSEENTNVQAESIPIELYHELIKQSEKDFEQGKITKQEDFEKEALLW